MAERSTSTPIDTQTAEIKLRTAHPIVTALEANAPAITELEGQLAEIPYGVSHQQFVRDHYGFVADSFVASRPYTLTADDLQEIWPRVNDVVDSYALYGLAGALVGAYCIQGTANPDWSAYPRTIVEEKGIPDVLLADEKGLRYVRGRLDQVAGSIHEASARRIKGVRENFGNGLITVVADLNDALRNIERTEE